MQYILYGCHPLPGDPLTVERRTIGMAVRSPQNARASTAGLRNCASVEPSAMIGTDYQDHLMEALIWRPRPGVPGTS